MKYQDQEKTSTNSFIEQTFRYMILKDITCKPAIKLSVRTTKVLESDKVIIDNCR